MSDKDFGRRMTDKNIQSEGATGVFRVLNQAKREQREQLLRKAMSMHAIQIVAVLERVDTLEDERKQLAAELLPHLATIMRLTRPAAGTVQAWLSTANILQITLKDLIEEVQRQERQEGQQ